MIRRFSLSVALWVVAVCLAACNSGTAQLPAQGDTTDSRTLHDAEPSDINDWLVPDALLDLADGVGPLPDVPRDLDATDLADVLDAVGDQYDVPLDLEVDQPPMCPEDPSDPDGDGLDNQSECQWGTDPGGADTDFDGVSDGAEVLDGTQPTDPASALSWHPELVQVHPRLFFSADQTAALRVRWNAPGESQADLKARVIARCNEATLAWPADGSFDISVSRQHGLVAAACAFQGLMEQNVDLLQRAAELMAAPFPDPSYLGEGLLIPKAEYGLLESEGLVAWCSAYDFLAGATDGEASIPQGQALTEPLEAAKQNLLQRLALFRKLMHKDAFWVMAVTAQNNHLLKAFGAFGLCAMALNDRPDAAFDLNEAVAGMTFTFAQHQSVAEGGYGEGWNYLTYGAESFLPFMVAYHLFAQGKPLPYWNPSTYTDQDPLALQLHWYQDFAVHPVFRAVFQKALWSTTPGGLMVNTDDANPSPLHGALLAWLFDDNRFLWNWQMPAVGRYAGLTPEVSFVLLDEAQIPAAPDWPLDFSLPDAGFAVLRSGFEPGDVMLVVQGEHGPVNSAGGGHEHPDPTSFLLHAFGEYLALDPGYINFEMHDLVKTGEDHNVILVDGLGPEMVAGYLSKTEGFITDFQQESDATSVEVVSTYRDVQVTRRILRPASSGLFVVADTLVAQQTHDYTFQLNGNGGAEAGTSFELRDDGALWSRPAASLQVWTWALDGPPALCEAHAEEHATTWGQWAWHQMFTASAQMGETAGFLSLVVPVQAGTPSPVVTLLYRGGGAALARVQWNLASWRILLKHANVTAQALMDLELLLPDQGALLPGVHVLPDEPA